MKQTTKTISGYSCCVRAYYWCGDGCVCSWWIRSRLWPGMGVVITE